MRPDRSLKLEEIDLSPLEFWGLPPAVREGAFETLRREDPVRFFEEVQYDQSLLPAGRGYWAITRHAHVLEVSRNPALFSSALGATSIIDLPPQMLDFFGGMINMDAPRHGRQRRIVSRGFTPRSLRRTEEQVDLRARAIVDRVIEKGECDFVSELAAPLPLEIICDLMGIPESQTQFVFEKSNLILGLGMVYEQPGQVEQPGKPGHHEYDMQGFEPEH